MKAKDVSRLLSLVLRHKPEHLNITLDEHGWTAVEVLLSKMKISLQQLVEVVENNDKQRFSFNENQTKIRANQGHSIPVELDLAEVAPDFPLFHGTAEQHVASILATGLTKGKRHHVHLARNHDTAVTVGMRSGTAVLLQIDAPAMVKDGYAFYVSENGVYLTDHVPPNYIKLL